MDGRTPEDGIEAMEWSIDELWQATRAGEFDLSLHVSILMRGVMAGTEPRP